MGNNSTGRLVIFGTGGDMTKKEKDFYDMWIKDIKYRDSNGRFASRLNSTRMTNGMITPKARYKITNDNTK
jgi:hypothetical protein